MHQDLHTRKKRGLFDSIGRALKIVTGTMDADDESYYEDKINTITLDNRRTYQLEKDQLTIIQSTLWGVNKTTLEMKHNQDLLSESYKYLEDWSKNNREQIKDIALKYSRHTELIQQLIIRELIVETQNAIEILYNAIDEARQSRISSYLIKPIELINILRNVQSHLHVGDSLPIPVTTNTIYQYYDIIKLTVYFSNNNWRYVIRIPLRHISRRVHLFKIIPLPKPVPDFETNSRIYTFPEITSNYIAFSEDLQYYVTPTEAEVKKCTKLPLIICDNMPVMYPVDESSTSHVRCEIQVFKNVTNQNCNFNVTKIINPVWEKIPYSNTDLFSHTRKWSDDNYM